MTPTEKCIQLLDKIMLTDGEFNRDEAMKRLSDMRATEDISIREYIELIDACNNRATDEHYEKCRIYKRALAETEWSASPDLLEALKRIERISDTLLGSMPKWINKTIVMIVKEINKQARVAIAKARGG